MKLLKKRMLLTEWAKLAGIPVQQAKDMARHGRMGKDARMEFVKVKRWTIPADFKRESIIDHRSA